jgi:hypothetical protein
MNILKIIKLSLIGTIIIANASAQDFSPDKVSKSVQKKVMEFPDFSKYEATCISLYECMSFDTEKDSFTNSDYHTHVKAYKLNISKDQLFDVLENSHPKNLWQNSANFQMLYRASENKVFYDSSENIKVRKDDFITLELTPKLGPIKKKMPVSFQILEINREKGILSFSYLTNNVSKGIQQLDVHSLDHNHIAITHTSRYLSGNKFRDNKLYVPFHEQFTDGFYIDLEALILQP